MEIKDHIILICAHSNTQRKKQSLLNCINSTKSLGFDTILCSHFPEDKDVYSQVNYFSYDAYDPVVNWQDYINTKIVNFVFYEDNDFRIDWTPPFIHDYSVFNLLRNGVLFARSLNKTFIHVIEYDCLVDVDLFTNELVKPLTNHDISYSIWDRSINHLMAAYMFSFRLDKMVELFSSINGQQDYFRNRIYEWQLERVLNDFRLDNSLKSYLNAYPQELMNRNSIFQQTNILNELRPCVNSQGKLYIHARHKLPECLVNIVYGNFNKFINLQQTETIELDNYRPGTNLKIYFEGQTLYDKTLDQPLDQFYKLNKLRNKKALFYPHINKGFKLGMRQSYEEVEEFCKFLLDKDVKNFLEIGTDQGGSFSLLSNITDKNGIKITVDLPHAHYGVQSFNITDRNNILRQLPGRISIIEGDSHTENTFSTVKNALNGEKLDLLFIDGDHSFDGVKKDFEMYSSLVRDDGIIAFHDITYPKAMTGELINVWEFWNMLDGEKYEFTSMNFWGGIGVIIKNNKLRFNKSNVKTPATINYHFINGAFCEVLSAPNNKYVITFSNSLTNQIIYRTEIDNNHWSKSATTYFIPYRIQVSSLTEKGLIFDTTLNLTSRNVYIALDSRSLGDTLAWIPYVEEFRKKHFCNIVCSTFWNNLFIEAYPSIKFVDPGTVVDNLTSMYEVGWFENGAGVRNPIDPRTVPLQKIASDILGLEHKQVKPTISIKINRRQIKEKYVCISTMSTCQAKLWNYPNGWQIIVDYLNRLNFKVVVVQSEETYLKDVVFTPNLDINQTVNLINHSEFFIGLSSGLSWVAWALSKRIIMISGVTKPWNEFECIRIYNDQVCNGCFNDTRAIFDKSNWFWCPFNKNFECSRLIQPSQVIHGINTVLQPK